jgi:hypothetical protein
VKRFGLTLLAAVILPSVIALLLIAGAHPRNLRVRACCSVSRATKTSSALTAFSPSSLIESPDGNFYGTAAGGGVGTERPRHGFQVDPERRGVGDLQFRRGTEWTPALRVGPQQPGRGHRRVSLRRRDFQRTAGPWYLAFKLSKSGTIVDLHDFCADFECSDGAYPAFMTQALDGNFYGATGPSSPPANVLFRLSPDRNFQGCARV